MRLWATTDQIMGPWQTKYLGANRSELLLLVVEDLDVGGGVGDASQGEALGELVVLQEGLVGVVDGA